VEALGVVAVEELLRVAGPDRVEVEPVAGELDLARRALAVLRLQHELVLAALVGEVGDGLAVRAPRRGALVDAGCVRQVADVALLGRYGDDLAAELDGRPRPTRGGADVPDVPRPLGV